MDIIKIAPKHYRKGAMDIFVREDQDSIEAVAEMLDASFVESPAPPSFANLADAKAAMIKWIEHLEMGITGERSLGEKLSWPTKLLIAKEYLANQSGEVPAMIATESALRETTPVDLAQLIVDKGMAFAAASSAIAGLRAKTEAALETVTDPYDYEVVLTQAATQAEALKAQLGL
jgi:hypothetical protein